MINSRADGDTARTDSFGGKYFEIESPTDRADRSGNMNIQGASPTAASSIDWAPYYLEFDKLVSRLNATRLDFGLRKAVSTRSLTGETRTLAEILDKEVEKIVLFFLRIQGDLARQLWSIREKQVILLNGDRVATMEQLESMNQQFRDLGYQLLDLLSFLEYNVTGLRRLLKKHDKQFELKLGKIYFNARLGGSSTGAGTGSGSNDNTHANSSSSKHKHSPLLQLYHQEGLLAIIGTLRNGFSDVYEAQAALKTIQIWREREDVKRLSLHSNGHVNRSNRSSPERDRIRGYGTGVDGGAVDYGSITPPSTTVGAFIFSPSSFSSANNSTKSYIDRYHEHEHENGGLHGGLAGMGIGSTKSSPGSIIPKTTYLSRLTASHSMPLLAGLDCEAGARVGTDACTSEYADAGASTQYTSSKGLVHTASASNLAQTLEQGYGQGSGVSLNLTRSMSDLEPVLKRITETQERVTRSQRRTTSEYFATHSDMAQGLDNRRVDEDEDTSDDDDGLEEDTMSKVRSMSMRNGGYGNTVGSMTMNEQAPYTHPHLHRITTNKIGLFLNLLVTFLFMANQYVVAPTSGEYSLQLGESKAMSGLIIGLSPLAALLSTIVYSIWTNHAFKAPLITSILLATLGNLLYGLALQNESNNMLLFGRFLCGLGAPRIIARRYISDHVSLKHRTLASSYFVTAGALGLAFGPIVSCVVGFSHIDVTLRMPIWASSSSGWYGDENVQGEGNGMIDLVRFNDVTAPGWVMFVLWGLALCGTTAFVEPPECSQVYISVPDRGQVQAQETERREGYKYLEVGDSYADTREKYDGKKKDKDKEKYNIVHVEMGDWIDKDFDKNKDYGNNIEDKDYGNVNSSNDSFPQRGRTRSDGDDYSSYSGSQSGAPTFDDGYDIPISVLPHKYFNNYTHTHADADADADADVLINIPMFPRSISRVLSTFLRLCSYYTSHVCSPLCSISIWDYVNFDVTMVLFIYGVNKIAQEMVVASIPDLTWQLFEWDASGVSAGLFMATCGALVLPANILVASLTDTEDRVIVFNLFYLQFLGVFFLLDLHGLFGVDASIGIGAGYSVFQYIVGSILLFATLNAQEGVLMSILSSVTTPEMAKSTINSAFLATEVGTGARVISDVSITLVMSTIDMSVPGGDVLGLYSITNVFYGTIACLMVASMSVFYVLYDRYAE